MTSIACLMLLAASTSLELSDEVYRVAPHDLRYMELSLNQRPALVEALFEVNAGPPRVRLALMRREDFDRFRLGQPRAPLAISPAGATGRVFHDVARPGDYVLVVENRAAAPAEVHLRVMLDFSGRHSLTVTQISPERRAVVIALSMMVFVAIVSYSARRLLRNFNR